MPDIQSLIERVEAATADATADLIREAATLIFGAVPDRMNRMLAADAHDSAALMLVPDGVAWAITNIDGGDYTRFDFEKPTAVVQNKPGDIMSNHVSAATPALALVAASLKARAQQGEG